MDLITEALHYIGKNHPTYKAVQIGAMDGINFDDTRGFFDMYKWESILVEPIPEIFEELKVNLKDRENIIYENSAIGPKQGKLTMLTIPSSAIKEYDLHPGYKGMSATYPLKNGFGSDYERDIEVKTKYGKDIEVDCITFDQLVDKHSFNDVNILVCDAEGYDWEIFKEIDLSKYNLQFIRLEYMNLSKEEKEQLIQKLESNGYKYTIGTQDIDAVKKEVYDKLNKPAIESSFVESSPKENSKQKSNVTIVSGLWDLGRTDRGFEGVYIPRFKEFLQMDANLILFLPEELHEIVWEIREKSNTRVVTMGLDQIKDGLFAPHWDYCQKIRNDDEWRNITGTGGWLQGSPQLTYEYYNPVVMSKMFMLHDATIYNDFNTEFFFWVDAGLTMTVDHKLLTNGDIIEKFIDHANPFLFLSFPYANHDEFHGFKADMLELHCNTAPQYCCRGGLFGGHREQIREANAMYYGLLNNTLEMGYMGTEETIFTIMAHKQPQTYRRFMLDPSGHIYKFYNHIQEDKVKLVEIDLEHAEDKRIITDKKLKDTVTNLYMLTFNFPKQVRHTIETMKQAKEWLTEPNLFLLDNSTDQEAKKENVKICKEHNFEYIDLKSNTGICGGRQAAAEHFHESGADYMFFFEDDMTVNPPDMEGRICRNGLNRYIHGLYKTLHKIMILDKLDYLKLSFTEVYMDNDKQCAWYNVPQNIRTRDWPNYDKLPVNGLDKNSPLTKFDKIKNVDGVSYITGEIYYANWPQIVSKAGNKKIFIDTKYAHPYEQTWMSLVYQLQKEEKLTAAVLLASPIWHERIAHYKPEERREN